MLNDFYFVTGKEPVENGFAVRVQFRPDHEIYKVHFPARPITPGACLLQIAKNLIEEEVGTKLFTRQIKNIKFLNVINPEVTGSVVFQINLSCIERQVNATVTVSDDSNIYAKISASYEK